MSLRILCLVAMMLAVSGKFAFAQTSTPDAKLQQKVENPFPDRVKAPDGILDGGQEWLNSSGEITLKDLRGKIVVVDFWTYCCINCIHVLPDLKYLEEKYPNELVVIGVHSAKFDNEKVSENIRQAIMRYEISHPVVNDAEMTIWRKFGARSWPTLAIIDPEGYYLGAQPGEGHRELFDAIIGRLIKYHRAKGTLDERPVEFDLERSKVKSGPLRYPGKVLADEAGRRVFVSDTGHNRIVVADMAGKVLATIGSGAIGLRDGGYDEAEFDHPQGMALVDEQLYVADTENHCIRVVDLKAQTVTTVAGTGQQARRRVQGGRVKTTPLNSPWALQHLDGILFIAMAGPHQLWQHVIGSDQISVYAGSGAEDVINGGLKTAALAQPSGLATDGNSLYVADSEGSAIRKVGTSTDGEVTTIAGTSELPRGQSLFAFGDRDGVAAEARLQHPLGVALAGDVLFIADSYNHKIKKLNLKTNEVTTWAGDGKPGAEISPARFSEPGGLSATESALYVADTNNHRICRINLADSKVSVLNFDGLVAPTPPPRSVFGDLKPVVMAAQKVKPGKVVEVAISLDIPEGYKINQEMPVLWQATNVGDDAVLAVTDDGSQRTAAENQIVKLRLPLHPDAKQGQVQVTVRYGYCRDGVGGLCRISTKAWRIPLTLDASGTEQIAINEAKTAGSD